MEILKGKCMVKGSAQGVALVIKRPLTFRAEINLKSGEILKGYEGEGLSVANRILVFPGGKKGLTGTWRYLLQLAQHGSSPAAIITGKLPDPTLVQGAILANIPVMCNLSRNPLDVIKTGDFVKVDANGIVTVSKEDEHDCELE